MTDYLILLAGIAAAGIGGELFVRGAVGLARWARIPAGIIGATIAAFATSSPELAIAVNASLAGEPEIALGNALGSNIVNISLILAISLVISGTQFPRDALRRDFPVALLAPFLIGILAFDGAISRIDASILFAVFITWLTIVVLEVRKQRSKAVVILAEKRQWLAIAAAVIGLGSLILSGHFVVAGAKGISESFGLEEFVVGATIVAIGTTMPELATVVISKLRGHEEVGLGMILGSNIFNNFWIVSFAALVTPMMSLPLREVAIGLSFGAITLALIFPLNGYVGRRRGVLLLILYLAYVITILQQ